MPITMVVLSCQYYFLQNLGQEGKIAYWPVVGGDQIKAQFFQQQSDYWNLPTVWKYSLIQGYIHYTGDGIYHIENSLL